MKMRQVPLLFITLIFLAAALIQPSHSHAARDMSDFDILGLRVGITPEEARGIISSLQGLKQFKEKSGRALFDKEQKRVRAFYVTFDDDRFLNVSFGETRNGNRVSEISLVYQERSYSKTLLDEAMAKYGKPDSTSKSRSAAKIAWGGKAEDEGAISRYKGINTTLLLEQTAAKLLTLTLTRHEVSRQKNSLPSTGTNADDSAKRGTSLL